MRTTRLWVLSIIAVLFPLGRCRFSHRSSVCCLMLTLTGCGNLPAIVLPNELLPEIEYVMANQSDFAPDADDPLAEVVAGEVRDPLANLDGCWGAFDVFSFGYGESSEPQILDDFEFYEFHSATKDFEYQVLQDFIFAPLGRVVAFVSHRGTFEITDVDRIIVTITAGTVNDPTTGDLIELPFDLELGGEAEAYVTVTGDRMKISGIYDFEGNKERTLRKGVLANYRTAILAASSR